MKGFAIVTFEPGVFRPGEMGAQFFPTTLEESNGNGRVCLWSEIESPKKCLKESRKNGWQGTFVYEIPVNDIKLIHEFEAVYKHEKGITNWDYGFGISPEELLEEFSLFLKKSEAGRQKSISQAPKVNSVIEHFLKVADEELRFAILRDQIQFYCYLQMFSEAIALGQFAVMHKWVGPIFKAEAHFLLSTIHEESGNLASALKVRKLGIQILEDLSLPRIKLDYLTPVFLKFSYLQEKEGKVKAAIESLSILLDLFEQTNTLSDEERLAIFPRVLGTMGRLLVKGENLSGARKMLDKINELIDLNNSGKFGKRYSNGLEDEKSSLAKALYC